MDSPAYQQNVISAAASGALILTANKRLSRHLRDCFDRQMLDQGKAVWATPEIISYEGWLGQCLNDLDEGWRYLTQHQQQCLWEEQIEKSCRGTTLELLQLRTTAEKAVNAHRLLSEYEISLAGQQLTEDQRVFSLWRQHYIELCQRHGWMDQSDLPKRICHALNHAELKLPQHILLIGFDQLSPGILLLQKTVRDKGGSCEEVAIPPVQAGQILRYAARDSQHEIEAAACWTRRLLEQGAQSIGIVVPDLQVKRRALERIFRDQIDPAATAALNDDDSVFSLSLGGALAEQGIIYAALECLRTSRQLSLDQTSFLLRTPYLPGVRKEADTRAQLDQRLRSFHQQRFKLARLKGLAEEKNGLSELVRIFNVLGEAQQANDKASPGVWAERFSSQLQALGWPGDRPLASGEYQAVKVWHEKALTGLAGLDHLLQPMNRRRALNLLRQLAKDIDFQLEGPTGAVQVVGLLESSGLSFQHLWVMGLGETVLPSAPQPNPFIPYRLQEDNDMPHSSAARELEFAEHVIARLKTASRDIVFSYPLRDGDCALRPSPLIRDCAESVNLEQADFQDLAHLMHVENGGLESFSDACGPRLQQLQVAGGTDLLKDQAHCPFRAFVHHRLYGRAFDKPAPGISPIVRGDLVHLTLEQLWKHLQNYERLIGMTPGELDGLIHQQVTLAIETYFKNSSAPSDQLLELEKERIETLMKDWFENVEMLREPFQVMETEQQHIEIIGPLQISLQVDRIDLLENGCRLVIDYKTGRDLHAEDFLSKPLIEPQLPIYAVAKPDSTADGIAFAQLRRGACRFLGVVREKGLLGQVRDLSEFAQSDALGITDWPGLLLFWRRQIQALAEDFVSGNAVVKPYDLLKSCRYCDLPGLCRVQEAAVVMGVEDDS